MWDCKRSDVWDLGDVGGLKVCPVLRLQTASLISLPEYLYAIDTLFKKKKKDQKSQWIIVQIYYYLS